MVQLDFLKDREESISFVNKMNEYQRYMKNHPSGTQEDIMKDLGLTLDEILKIEEVLHEDILDDSEAYEYQMDNDTFQIIKDRFSEYPLRNQQILDYRFGIVSGEKHSISETASKFQLSSERVKQIEARIIRKIQKEIKGDFYD